MKSGKITHYIEIPVTVSYSVEEHDDAILFQTGPYIVVDAINYADEDEIYAIIGKESDAIKEACMEDANDTG